MPENDSPSPSPAVMVPREFLHRLMGACQERLTHKADCLKWKQAATSCSCGQASMLRELKRVAGEPPADPDDDDELPDRCECQDCNAVVHQDDPYFGTPCGTFCDECMDKHVKTCGVCASEFRDDFEHSDD